MKALRFHGNVPEWDVPMPELAPVLKQALRIQWREFIEEIKDVEGADHGRSCSDLSMIAMFERALKAG